MRKELVVIGGGPAGITLAKKLGQTMDMAVIRPEDHSMIYCAMPYVIEGILPLEKTFKKDELVTGANAELIRDSVAFVDFTEKKVRLERGEDIFWDKLVIATGARPFIPPLPGAKLEGVMAFKTQNDLESILSHCDGNLKNALVIGAGAIGVELAQALKERGLDVQLIDMAPSVLSNMADDDMTKEAEQELLKKGIRLHLNTKVTGFKGTKHVEEAVLDNGESIVVSSGESNPEGIVVFAAGVTPEISFLEDTALKTEKDGIVVNAFMETNIKDVYACGDCAQYQSGVTNKPVSGKLATNAVPMARVLADNLLGKRRPYPGFFNGAATRVGATYVGGTGLGEATAKKEGFDTVTGTFELTTQFPIMPGARPLKVKLIAERKSGRILGGQVTGGEPVTSKIDLLTFSIQKNATAEDLRDLSYSAQPYQSFFPAANAVVMAAEQIVAKCAG